MFIIRLGRFHLIIPEIGISSSGRIILEMMLHLIICTRHRKVVDGYNRNIFSLPKHHIRINRAFATLVRPIVRNTGCDPLFFTTSSGDWSGLPNPRKKKRKKETQTNKQTNVLGIPTISFQ